MKAKDPSSWKMQEPSSSYLFLTSLVTTLPLVGPREKALCIKMCLAHTGILEANSEGVFQVNSGKQSQSGNLLSLNESEASKSNPTVG